MAWKPLYWYLTAISPFSPFFLSQETLHYGTLYFFNMSYLENQLEKPELKREGPVLLSLKVKDQGGQEVTFKAKLGMKLEKLMHAFDKNQGKDPGTYRFFFEGQRLQKTDTPESMGMEDEDIIEAFLEQLGGSHAFYWVFLDSEIRSWSLEICWR